FPPEICLNPVEIARDFRRFEGIVRRPVRSTTTHCKPNDRSVRIKLQSSHDEAAERGIMLGPIFNREWLTLPRRSGHYFTRSLYLGGLWVLLLTVWQVTVGWEFTATLGDLARFGLMSFHVLAYVQLTLLLFFAALSAASTISLEKDRRTFLLLLLTDLRNYEIVLGKLLGSLLQIGLFLLGSIPVFALLMILGGIDPLQIAATALILLTTALAAGSLGGLVALWRDKTFQALAMTVLILVLFMCLVQAIPLLTL